MAGLRSLPGWFNFDVRLMCVSDEPKNNHRNQPWVEEQEVDLVPALSAECKGHYTR